MSKTKAEGGSSAVRGRVGKVLHRITPRPVRRLFSSMLRRWDPEREWPLREPLPPPRKRKSKAMPKSRRDGKRTTGVDAKRRRRLRGSAPVPGARCPFCGSTEFVDYRDRRGERCASCRSHARVRAAWVILTGYCRVQPDTRIVHFAPEPLIAKRLREKCGDRYQPYDLNNERYPLELGVQHFDLCRDLPRLPKAGFDVVLHNHVIEHVTCNYTIVLQRLHDLLRPGGTHVFSLPIGKGYFKDDISPKLTHAERTKNFGQWDHVRHFGRNDLERTLGMVFGITQDYDLSRLVPAERLLAAAVPPERWTVDLSPTFVVDKQG